MNNKCDTRKLFQTSSSMYDDLVCSIYLLSVRETFDW